MQTHSAHREGVGEHHRNRTLLYDRGGALRMRASARPPPPKAISPIQKNASWRRLRDIEPSFRAPSTATRKATTNVSWRRKPMNRFYAHEWRLSKLASLTWRSGRIAAAAVMLPPSERALAVHRLSRRPRARTN